MPLRPWSKERGTLTHSAHRRKARPGIERLENRRVLANALMHLDFSFVNFLGAADGFGGAGAQHLTGDPYVIVKADTIDGFRTVRDTSFAPLDSGTDPLIGDTGNRMPGTRQWVFSGDLQGFWAANWFADASRPILIQIEVWDYDSVGSDDVIDINPESPATNLGFYVDPQTGLLLQTELYGTITANRHHFTVEGSGDLSSSSQLDGEHTDGEVNAIIGFSIDSDYTSTSIAQVVGDDLVIEDSDRTGANNRWTITRDGSDLVISDADFHIAAFIVGAEQVDYRTVRIPVSALNPSGKIIFKGQEGNDTLNVGSLDDIGFDVQFDGDLGTNTLGLLNDLVTDVTHAVVDATSGSVSVTDATTHTVSYSSVQSITDDLVAVDRRWAFSGAAETINLASTPDHQKNTLVSTASPSFSFVSPANLLTIDASGGNDTVNLGQVATLFNPALAIDGGSGADAVNLNASLALSADRSLSVNSEQLNVGSGANLATTGSGTVTFVANNMSIASTATISSASPIILKPQTNGTAIDLGGVDGVATLGLTDAELDRIAAPEIRIGDTNSGILTVVAAISRPLKTDLSVDGQSISIAAGGSVNLADGKLKVGHGNLTVNGTISHAAIEMAPATQLRFNTNSTLDNATLTSGVSALVTGNHLFLNHSTIGTGSTLDLAVQNSQVTVSNGLTIDGTLLLGNASGTTSSTLWMHQSQTIGGTGTLQLGRHFLNSIATLVQGPIAFTFGPNLTIQAMGGQIIGEGSAASNPTFIVNGTLNVMAGGTGLYVRGDVGTFTTNGSVNVASGMTLTVEAKGAWNHTGSLVSGANATVNMANIHNTGSITISSSILNLTGAVTQANLGTVNRTGGTINLFGTLTGGLTLNDTTGPWYLFGGTVNGGTIVTSGTNTLRVARVNGPGSFLNAVTIAAGSTLDMAEQISRINVSGGLTIDGTLLLGNAAGTVASELTVSQTQTIGGTGSLIVGKNQNNFISTGIQASITATFGPNLTIQAASGMLYSQGSAGTYVIDGTLNVLAGGIGLIVRNSGALITSGTVNVAAGAVLSSEQSGTWNQTGSVIAGTNTTVTAANLHNTGTIAISNSILNLTGAVTQANVGIVNRSGGTINLFGTLTGGLTLNDTTGPWYLRGGLVDGGTIVTSGTNTLRVGTINGPGGFLNGVTIAAGSTLDMAEQISRINVSGGLTIDGTLLLGNAAGTIASEFTVSQTQTIGGTGTLLMGKNQNNFISTGNQGSVTATFGPGLTIQADGGQFYSQGSAATNPKFIFNGTIVVQPNGSGPSIAASVANVEFNGNVTVNSNSSFAVNSKSWTVGPTGTVNVIGGLFNGANSPLTNLAGGVLSGGTWQVNANSTLRLPGSVTTAAANLVLSGLNSNVYVGGVGITDALAGLTFVSSSGGLTLSNGRNFAPSSSFTNAGNLTVEPSSKFGYLPSNPPSNTGLVGRWSGQGNTQDSAGSNHGAWTGAASYVPGVVGQAFNNPDGSSLVIVPNSSSLNVTGDLTIALWIKPNVIAGAQRGIFDKRNPDQSNVTYGFFIEPDGRLAFTSRFNGGAFNTVSSPISNTITAGVLTHVAVTIQGATLKLFINGVEVQSAPYNFTRPSTTGVVATAISPGLYDEVLLYNRALSPNEILSMTDYRDGVAVNQTDGTVTANGTLSATTFNQTAGILKGSGKINGNTVIGGSVRPGNPTGTLSINGNYTQTSSGSLDLEIGGTTAGTQYDRLAVTSAASLGGTLNISLVDGFGPSLNQIFTPLTFASLLGDFTKVSFPISHGEPAFTRQFTASSMDLLTLTQFSLSNSSVLEDRAIGTVVGTLNTSAPDNATAYVYSLVNGSGDTDNAKFKIEGDTLKSDAVFDFETQSSYSIRVRTTNPQGQWVEKPFIISVTDVQEDTTPPRSVVQMLASNATGLAIPIVATGSDTANNGTVGSGIKDFDLYVAVDGGAFAKFATVPFANPTTIYQATSNHAFFFRSVARDHAGNQEVKPANSVDTFTRVGDFDKPVTRVVSAVSNATGLFSISVSGTEYGGSQLASFDVFVSIDGGTPVTVGTVSGGTPAAGVYTGKLTHQGAADGVAHTYRFFSRGRDTSGNYEDATTTGNVTVNATFAPSIALKGVGIDVQSGAAQRSFINQVDILFNTSTGISALTAAGRVKVERFGLSGAVTEGTGVNVPITSIGLAPNAPTKLRLNFGTGLSNDGFYRIRADVNGDSDFNDPGEAFEFFRLLGDANGDAIVDALDTAVVDSLYGRIASGLDGDMNGDGRVDGTDKSYTLRNYRGRKLDDLLKPLLDD